MAVATVGIVLGSDSDWRVMEACRRELTAFGVSCEVRVISAHRTPDQLQEFAQSAERRGLKILIAGAGMAAALPGVLAAYCELPVIGVPLAVGPFQGLDSLLSMVQMPGGIPVATVSTGEAGAKNAAILAVEILALSDLRLKDALKNYKRKLAETVDRKNQTLQEQLRLDGPAVP